MTQKLTYLIKLRYDKIFKGYVADVANLYGCMSQGKTKKEALKNARKAIRAYMETLKKEEIKSVISVPISFPVSSVSPFSYA